MSVRLLVTARTDVGRVRPGNEDAVLVTDDARLVAVADGMGGHQAGEVASATAIAALLAGVERGDPIDVAITGANDAVVRLAADDHALRGMGTTLTAGTIDGSTFLIGHVGDSRAYLLRDGELRQLTTDHSVVAELVAAGELTEAEALTDPRRAMITRALGIDPSVDVDVLSIELAPGDRLLLCSDGLTSMVRDDVIAEVLGTEPDRERAADALVAAANLAGGADNITVVVADVVPADDRGDDEADGDAEPDLAAGNGAFDDTEETPVVSDADSPARRRWWSRRRP
jgi:protein phosphatase